MRKKKDQIKSSTIGLQVPDLHNKYFFPILKGVSDTIKNTEHNLIIFPGQSPNAPNNYGYQCNVIYSLINKRNLDVIILSTGSLCNFLTKNEFKKFYKNFDPLPVISIGIPLPQIPSVIANNKTGMEAAFIHLIEEHKYKKIAFIKGALNNAEAEKRYDIYVSMLKKYNVPYNPDLVFQGNFLYSSGINAVNYFIDIKKQRPEVIVAANDDMAFGTIDALEKRGIRVPFDIAVTGYDNIEKAELHIPSLTTIEQPAYQMGEAAALIALKVISHEKVPLLTTLQTKLIIRSSCGCNNKITLNNESTNDNKKIPTKNDLKDQIIKKIFHKNDILMKNSVIKDNIHNLIEILINKKIEKNDFITDLQKIFKKCIHNNIKLDIWETILNILKKYLLNYFQNKRKKLITEALNIINTTYNDFKYIEQGIRRVQLEESVFWLSEVLTKVSSTLSLDEITDILQRELPKYGIETCAISLYTKSKIYNRNKKWIPPYYSKLIMAYNPQLKANINSKSSREFPSEKIIPEGILLESLPYTIVVEPLFHMKEQLGRIIYHYNANKGHICHILTSQLSSAIKSAMLFTEREIAQKNLQKALIELEKINFHYKTLSNTDEMTGLYNRRGFIDLAQNSLLLAKRKEQNCMLFFIDLDGLKKINDEFGHPEGDFAIKKVAEFLQEIFRQSDIIGRIGGDEFVALAINAEKDFIKKLEERLDKKFEQFNKRSYKAYNINATMGGIMIFPDKIKSLDLLLKNADKVLYKKKKKKLDNKNL